jgi:uncharacterized membrane protein
MSYVATIPVEFPCPAAQVYEAMCDLSNLPLWSSGITSVSHSGRMVEGLHYEAANTLPGGRINVSEIEVKRLVPNQAIELVNYAGLVAYQATYRFRPIDEGHCEVTCYFKFEFRNYVLKLARPAIEGMAEARIRGDLESLRAIICGKVE